MTTVTLPADLAQDIADAFELIARGGIPSPERAAVLLQRLNTAMRGSRQSRGETS